MAELIDVPPGLANVAFADTEIGDVVGEQGYYHYRGQSAAVLARTSHFEDVAALVLGRSADEVRGDRSLPRSVGELASTIDLRTGVSALGEALQIEPLDGAEEEQQYRDAARLITVLPTLIASIARDGPVPTQPATSFTSRTTCECSQGRSRLRTKWRPWKRSSCS